MSLYALQSYISEPSKCKGVLFYDENVVIIEDAFPKGIRHYLILPRDQTVTKAHPLDVFNKNYKEFSGEELYDLISSYVERAKDMIVSDLSSIMKDDDSLKLASFKSKYIMAGVHSIPSMNNMHVHVITKDLYSLKMKNKKHYNSFATKFFVEFESLDPRNNEGYLRSTRRNEQDYDSDSDYGSQSDDSVNYIRHTRNPVLLKDLIKSDMKCLHCRSSVASIPLLKRHLRSHLEEMYGDFKGFDVAKLCPNGRQDIREPI